MATKRTSKSPSAAAKKAAAAPPPVSRTPFVLLLLMVFAAGAASLLYEVVWVRQLGHSLGSTAVATSVMLSAFLGGLAIGSWYTGRFADSLESPLMTLCWVEIAGAVVGALSVPALAAAGHAYVYIATITSAGSMVSLVLRAVFSLVVMMIPATIFGATFPLATAAAGRLTDREDAAGGVSAASCFGSALGAAVGGLFLEPALGLSGSAMVGASLNLLAALLAFTAARLVLEAAASPASAVASE
jgi:spermidine synthase